ncbi:pyridoxal phosphate-dependent aminotransferase [Anaeroglobus geminatus]|nr:histidinol-phosphate transaminase [Anaeroglobus geminatus]
MVYVSSLVNNLIRKYPNGDRSNILRLDMNENPGGLPQDIVSRMVKLITPEFLATYPDKKELIVSLSKIHNLPEAQFSVTDGSEMALKYIFETFGRPDSVFLSITPTFEMYGVFAGMYGLKHKKIEILDNFDIDFDSFINSIDENTSIVSMLNPNNPVGRAFLDEEFILVAEKANSVGALLIIDEAYHYFYEKSQIKLLDKYDNIIVLRTFSKLFSLAACRIGYAVADQKIIELMNRVRPTFDTNAIALAFANIVINDNNLIEYLINTELDGRMYLFNALDNAGYDYTYGGGNFVSIKTNTDPSKLSYNMLLNKKIAIKTFGYEILKDYIRVSTGGINYMKQFMEALLLLDK